MHRNVLLLIAIVLGAAACSNTTAPAGPVTATGKWSRTTTMGCQGEGVVTVTALSEEVDLQESGAILTGTYTETNCPDPSGAATAPATGSVDEASIDGDSVSFSTGWGTFTGTVGRSSMAGSVAGQNQLGMPTVQPVTYTRE